MTIVGAWWLEMMIHGILYLVVRSLSDAGP